MSKTTTRNRTELTSKSIFWQIPGDGLSFTLVLVLLGSEVACLCLQRSMDLSSCLNCFLQYNLDDQWVFLHSSDSQILPWMLGSRVLSCYFNWGFPPAQESFLATLSFHLNMVILCSRHVAPRSGIHFPRLDFCPLSSVLITSLSLASFSGSPMNCLSV